MSNKKLGRPTKERLAVLRNQATDLLYYGRIETTLEKAKSLKPYTEKILTYAINTYNDVTKVKKLVKNEKYSEQAAKESKANNKDYNVPARVEKEVLIDLPTKLAARKKIMNKIYDKQVERLENEKLEDFKARTKGIKHPLVEKIFNVYAPKYAKRAEELGNKGGYTRIIKIGKRQGDNADMAIIELV